MTRLEALFRERLARRQLVAPSRIGAPTPEEIQRIEDFKHLETTIPRVSPKYIRPTHLRPLLERIDLAYDGVPQRVCCSAPPRMAKTESVLHAPGYGLRKRPDWTTSYTTYADSLSRSKAKKARAIAERMGIKLETRAIGEWRTPEGGGMLSGGITGPLTGHGVNVMFIDDPVKNRVEAESPTYKARLRDFLSDVAATRIEPGGSIFIFMTRWTEDDLIGHAVRELGFEYICLPALNDAGESLWPERWSAEELSARRDLVGQYTWDSLYQQRPRPRGTIVFGPPTTYTELPTVFRQGFGVDLSYAAKTKSDYSVMVKGVRGKSADGIERTYITHVERRKVSAPEFQAVCHHHHIQAPGAPWRFISAGTELGAADFFRQGEFPVPLHTVAAVGDKFVRSIPYAAAWNAGLVLVPKSASWPLDEFLAVHANFTGSGKDACDDDVDASVAMFDLLASGGLPVSREVARPTRKSEVELAGM